MWSNESSGERILTAFIGMTMFLFLTYNHSNNYFFRWNRVIDPSLKKGDWTEEEDAAILAGVSEHGRKWATIREKLPGRCRDDIRWRYQKLAREKAKWNRWSDDEDRVLRDAVEQYGTRDWGLVAVMVKSRNAYSCKMRWCWQSKNKTTVTIDWHAEVSRHSLHH